MGILISASHPRSILTTSILAAAATLTLAGMTLAQDPTAAAIAPHAAVQPAPTTQDQSSFGIDKFDVVLDVSSQSGVQKEVDSVHVPGKTPKGLKSENDGFLLTANDIESFKLKLGVENGVYVAPAASSKDIVTVSLKELSYAAPAPYRASAITAIRKQIAQHLNHLGIIAVFVQPDPDQVQTTGTPDEPQYQDLREDHKSFKWIVQLGVVTSVRTIASGDRIPVSRRLNAREHDSIRYNSPIWPAAATTQPIRRDVINKNLLDDYVFALNRYPGRRVDVAVSQAEVPGGIVLDYLVSEAKPWTLYAQLSNTGTRQTNEWRERIGFTDNQLTGHDDVLTLDFITAGFSSASRAAVASYEAPIPTMDNLRARVYGSYNDFVASDVGQGQGASNNFNGDESTAGVELITNVYQHRDFFGDLVLGARYEHVHTTNLSSNAKGSADVILPYIEARVEQVADTSSFNASTTLTYGTTDASQDDLNNLGRLNADDSWVTLEASTGYSFYIEPLLFPALFRADADASGNAHQPKLANELAFSARGQTAFGSRLIPQQEDVAGGLYSVRGYPESIVAGDDVVIGSAEYRFHLPRAFDLQPTPSQLFGHPFRVAPDHPLGHPDWDLIFKAFIDAAQTVDSHRESYEHDDTLVGTGLGVELQLKQNINLQAYWGVALTSVEHEWDAGDNRFHFVFTVLY